MTDCPSVGKSGLNPIRILYVTAHFAPELGGTEIHTGEVAQRMSHRGAVVEVAAASRDPGQPREEWSGEVRIRRIRAFPRHRDYFFTPGLPAEIRANAPTLMHLQGYHTLVAPIAMLTALRASIPYVVTLHSGGHSSRFRTLFRPLQARLLRPLLTQAAALIAVSEFEAKLFARRLQLPLERFAIVPSGIDLPPVGPATDSDPSLIVSVGRLESYKGHDRIIQALPALRQHHPDIRLRLAGSGPQGARLLKLASKLGVADAVKIAPVADDRGAFAELLGRAAVVIALSRYESQGLAVQEAVGLGRPALVTKGSALDELGRYPNVLSVPEATTVSETEDAARVANAVTRLLNASSAPTPPMPTWKQCVDSLVEIYQDVLENPGRHHVVSGVVR